MPLSRAWNRQRSHRWVQVEHRPHSTWMRLRSQQAYSAKRLGPGLRSQHAPEALVGGFPGGGSPPRRGAQETAESCRRLL
eukprot:12741927-Alexandrium_andersonii.AAC.1